LKLSAAALSALVPTAPRERVTPSRRHTSPNSFDAYVSIRYGERLLEAGATASVGSVADSYDNAMAEALNGSFKAELIEHQGPWRDADKVEGAVVQWVGWYNTERLHSALDYLHPRSTRPSTTVHLATSNSPENKQTRGRPP
jgi:transposase InsO family protein